MKILKKIIIALIILAAIVVVVSFFLPSQIKVERAKVISAPIEVVYAQANNLKNFHEWDPWAAKDPNATFTFGDVYAGVGANLAWNSENKDVGVGSMTITEAVPFEKIVTNLEFEDGPSSIGGFEFEEVEGGTKVNWYMTADLGNNPMARIFGSFIDAMVGPEFEKGLLEMAAKAESAELVGDKMMQKNMKCISLKANVSMDEMGEIHSALFDKISKYMEKNEIAASGMPLTIYHSMSADLVDLECAIPFNAEAEVDEDFTLVEIPAQSVAKFVHRGDYANLSTTYEKAEAWLMENGLETTAPFYEVYVTDPGEEIDVNKWITHVYYPVN